MATANFNEPTSASDGNIPYIGAEPGDNNDGTTLRESFKRVNARLKEVFGSQDASNVVQTPFVDNDNIKDNAVDHDELANRYTASSSLSSGATISVASGNADVFTLTLGHSATLNFTGVKVGDIKTIVVTGGGSSYTLTLGTINSASATWNLITGTYDDTSSTKNLIQIKFVSTTEAWYSISQISS